MSRRSHPTLDVREACVHETLAIIEAQGVETLSLRDAEADCSNYDALMEARDSDPAIMLGEKGYDSDPIRQDLRDRGAVPEIPTKWNRHVQHSVSRPLYALRNANVAQFACSILEGLGYSTQQAGNAADALRLLEDREPVDAAFSDVVMPGDMNGAQLASFLRQQRPRLAVVLATGYSQSLTEWDGQSEVAPNLRTCG